MPTHIAFLRGINVGGKNKLPMKELVALFEAAGCENVRTYIQSGNVVFDAAASLARSVPQLLVETIETERGIQTPIVTRTVKELKGVLTSNPFLARDGIDEKALAVGFLAKKPTARQVGDLAPDRSPGDEFAVLGREIFLYLPNGAARSKLTNAWFDSRLKTVSTMRNWRTVQKVIELASRS